jgi:hypothetical protein
MANKKNGSKRKNTERTYLEQEEIQFLQDSLEEWNGKSDKKARDAFVVATVLPKIQQMNLEKFGPENLSKDKSAKLLWERRIMVSHWLLAFKRSISHNSV